MPDILNSFRKELNQARRQRKTDDILQFIQTNWKMFCPSRSHMRGVCQELEQRDSLTLDSLADALGIPDEVAFKRSTMKNAAGAFIRPDDSALVETFRKAVGARTTGTASARLCLVVVAGEHHSTIVTNFAVERLPGKALTTVEAEDVDDDIHIFPVGDAMARLPHLFATHTGDYYG